MKKSELKMLIREVIEELNSSNTQYKSALEAMVIALKNNHKLAAELMTRLGAGNVQEIGGAVKKPSLPVLALALIMGGLTPNAIAGTNDADSAMAKANASFENVQNALAKIKNSKIDDKKIEEGRALRQKAIEQIANWAIRQGGTKAFDSSTKEGMQNLQKLQDGLDAANQKVDEFMKVKNFDEITAQHIWAKVSATK